MGLFVSLVSRGHRCRRRAALSASAAPPHHQPASGGLADVFRAAHAELDQAPPPALSAAAFAAPAALASDLVLAFANPFINRPAASASGDKLELLVVDNSFSMRAGSRLADAKSEAHSVLDSRSPADRAQVAALGSQLHVLTQPIQDPGALRAAVDSIQPGDSRGSFGELARAVRSLAESVHTPIELHLFSDMQRDNMPANFSELALPPNVTLVLHPVVKSAGAELDRRKRQRARPGVGPEESARSGRDRGLPDSRRHAHRFAGRERKDDRHECRPGSRQRARHRELSIARRSLRLQPLRGEDRFGRRASPPTMRACSPWSAPIPKRVLFVHESNDQTLAALFQRCADCRCRIGFHVANGCGRAIGRHRSVAIRLRRSLGCCFASLLVRKRSGPLRSRRRQRSDRRRNQRRASPAHPGVRRPHPRLALLLARFRRLSHGRRFRPVASFDGEVGALGRREVLLRGCGRSVELARDRAAHGPDASAARQENRRRPRAAARIRASTISPTISR